MAFISADNMRNVLTALGDRIRDGDDDLLVAIESGRPPVRQAVYQMMVDMSQDTAYIGLSVDEMNRIATDSVVQFYKEIARQHAKELQTQQVVATDEGLGTDVAPTPQPRAPNAALSTAAGAVPGVTDSAAWYKPDKGTAWCLSIDGQDRNTRLYPTRYAFTYDLAEAARGVMSAVTKAVVLPVVYHTINCPFLLLVIDEFPSAYAINASDVVRRAFSKVIPKSQYSAQGGRTYTVLEPVANDKRAFDPPLPSLGRLTASLIRPNGDLVSMSRDDFSVVRMELGYDGGGPGGAATYTLTMNTAYQTDEFVPGDLVVMTGCTTGNVAFDGYINRDAGHEILGVVGEEPQAAIGRTTVVIRRAGEMNSIGIWEPFESAEDVFDDDKRLLLADSPVRILNRSVQMSITLEVECVHSTISELREAQST